MRFSYIWLLVLLAVTSGNLAAGDSITTPLHIRVLATHDFHGNLRPVTYDWSNKRPVGGATGLKSMLDDLETACRCITFRIDGGDQMQGTLESNLTQGVPVVKMFNYLELDAAAVGNHELDWGVDTLLARQSEAKYAWLAANVYRDDDGSRPVWAKPYTIIERDGVKVGIIGYTTISTQNTQRPQTTDPYEFRSGYEGIRTALDAVWKEKPDFVIITAHAAGECKDETGCAGEMVKLANELPAGSVQLIVGGHAHDYTNSVVQGIPIVRAGAYGQGVAVVDLYRSTDNKVSFNTSNEVPYADTARPDPVLDKLLASSMTEADTVGKRQVATVADHLSSLRDGDRRLGYLIADAVRDSGDTDIGLQNAGGVRADMLPGVITYSDVFRVTPFGNVVMRLAVTGRQIRQIVEQAYTDDYFSNLDIVYGTDSADKIRVDSVTFSDGSPVKDDGHYTLATNDYLVDGGDGMTILKNLPSTATGITVLDAVVKKLSALPSPISLPVRKQAGQK